MPHACTQLLLTCRWPDRLPPPSTQLERMQSQRLGAAQRSVPLGQHQQFTAEQQAQLRERWAAAQDEQQAAATAVGAAQRPLSQQLELESSPR